MLIKKSRDMGFCFGVRRAVDMMKEAAIDGRKVQTLGQVVHNAQVVAELEEIGISVKQDRAADGATADTVAITAHGVGETTVNDIKGTGLQRHRYDVSVRRPFPARRQASRRQGFHHHHLR